MNSSNLTETHSGEKPTLDVAKQAGWCPTPHAYFLEWRRHFPALEADLIGIILDRTRGCSKPQCVVERARIRMSTFMEYTGKSERSIQPALTRLAKKMVSGVEYTLIDIRGRKGGRGVVPSYAVDLEAVKAYVLAVKRAQLSRGKRAQVLRCKRAQVSAGGITDSLQNTDYGSSLFSEQLSYSEQPITDDESQKTAIPSPDAGGARAQNSKPNPGKPTKTENPAAPYATELEMLRSRLRAYMDGENPPEGFGEKCVLAAHGGASCAQIEEFLDRLWAKKKNRPGGRNGPRKWAWFLTVIGNEFSPIERGRSSEPVASAHPSNTASADDMARGIEALEVPDVTDSLALSHTCQCGAEIRQYTSGRVEGECRCSSKRAPGRVTAATLGKVLAGKRTESRAKAVNA